MLVELTKNENDKLNNLLVNIGKTFIDFENILIANKEYIKFYKVDNILFRNVDYIGGDLHVWSDGNRTKLQKGDLYYKKNDKKIYIWIWVDDANLISEIEFWDPYGEDINPLKDSIDEIFFDEIKE